MTAPAKLSRHARRQPPVKIMRDTRTGEHINPRRREKKGICRMFGLSGKRYQALEKRHRSEQGERRS